MASTRSFFLRCNLIYLLYVERVTTKPCLIILKKNVQNVVKNYDSQITLVEYL